MTDRRELYRSSNGDCWYLGRDPSDGRAIVVHEANRPSGGQVTCIDIVQFLGHGGNGPEQQALLRLIATLVEVPAYAART